jgi:MtN3 and saliva related transmembrane protein
MQEIIGFLAPALTIAAFLPQVLKVIKTKHTKDLSLVTFLTLIITGFLWAFYGFLLKDSAIIFTNSVIMCFALIIVVYKLRFK